MKLQDQVREFHEAFGCAIGERPKIPNAGLLEARLRFLAEEFLEILASAGCQDLGLEIARNAIELCIQRRVGFIDLPAFVDGHADLGYFGTGTMVAIGVNMDPVYDEVQRANMAKAWPDGKPRYRDDGKIIKPPGWTPPDIERVLREQGWTP